MARQEISFFSDNIAVADSDWMDCSACAPGFSIIVEGAGASDTCEIRVSNRQSIPDSAYQGQIFAAAAAITTSNIVVFPYAFRWIRVRRLTAGGTPAHVFANLFAVTPPAR